MPAVEVHFPTSPERTFAVLTEPRRYGFWVVGVVLTPEHGGTRVRMDEIPIDGLLAGILRRPRAHPLIRARNREALRRLCQLAVGDT